MALDGPLGTFLVVAIWTLCPSMTPQSLNYLLHHLLEGGVRAAKRSRLPRHASWVVVLGLTALLGGCTPMKSLEPLVDEQHVVSDPEIVGKWVLYDSDETLYLLEVEAEKNDPKAYRVTFSAPGGKSVYRAKLGRWDKEEFADVESLSVAEALGREANPLVVPTHSFCRIRQEDDILWLAFMDSDWAKEHLPKEKRREIHGWEFGEEETGIIFTGSTGELQEFVLRNAYGDKAFLEFRFAQEGTLAAYSQSLEVGYKGSAKLYTAERQYEEAALAWTRYVELEPKDPDAHVDLGLALLGINNAGRAREEFLERTRLCEHVPPAGHPRLDFDHQWCEDESPELAAFRQGVTYFVSDQYGQASREFEKTLQKTLLFTNFRQGTGTRYEPVLWDYLALHAAERETEARKLLNDKPDRIPEFLPPSGQPPFQLARYLRGEVTEAALLDSAREKWQQCEAYFVIGSQALIAGDKNKAREWFEKVVPRVFCPEYMAAATSARLKQLGAK